MGKSFCYLNRIYTDENDNTVFYELVFSDLHFTNPIVRLVSFNELQKISEDDNYISDFSITEGYLRCDSEVSRVEFHKNIAPDANKSCLDNTTLSLYSLLQIGVENDFCILDDKVAEDTQSEWVGNGIVPFCGIGFSHSSMSIYVQMILDNKIYNKYLVKAESTGLVIKPFYFAVPYEYTGEVCNSQFIKDVKINNKKYSVYRNTITNLFCMVPVITPPLINKACCLSFRLNEAIKTLKDYRKVLFQLQGKTSENLTWISDERRYSVESIELKSTLHKIADRDALIKNVISLCNSCSDLNEVKEKMEFVEPACICAANNLALIVCYSNGLTETISNLYSILRRLEVERFYCEQYVYKIRMYACLTSDDLVSITKPYFSGSDEAGITVLRRKIN